MAAWILAVALSVAEKRFLKRKGRVGRGLFWLRSVGGNILLPIIRIPSPALKPAKYL
jgi:hypothetical protein